MEKQSGTDNKTVERNNQRATYRSAGGRSAVCGPDPAATHSGLSTKQTTVNICHSNPVSPTHDDTFHSLTCQQYRTR